MTIYQDNSSFFYTIIGKYAAPCASQTKQLEESCGTNTPGTDHSHDSHHRDDPNNKVDLTDNIRALPREAQS